MTNPDETAQDIMDALDDLLETERKALLAGDLDIITRLLHDKEMLIDRLNTMEHGAYDSLRALHEKVTRNQALLDGALQGIRMVASRMGALRRIRKSVETYDEKGVKSALRGLGKSSVEKRA